MSRANRRRPSATSSSQDPNNAAVDPMSRNDRSAADAIRAAVALALPKVESLERRALFSGSIAEFGLTTGSSPHAVTAGPDGALWFTEPGTDKIGRITTTGSVTEFALTTGSDP